MNMTEEGLSLIREAEGFCANAYRDATGIWTIGYGHTSAAGDPHVSAGQVITRDEGEAIFRRDVEAVAASVRRAVTQAITDAQFSALVSFAYNVGLGNFRSSSVLKALNANELPEVPRRLQLWVKAGGKTLPGLVKRRAAEAALFATEAAPAVQQPARRPDRPTGKPALQSTTIWAAALAAVIALINETARWLGYGVLGLAAAACIGFAAWWIIRERLKKSRELGV